MADASQLPDLEPDPVAGIVEEQAQATVSVQSPFAPLASPSVIDGAKIVDEQPPFPILKGLTLAERNVVRREFEKVMYVYLIQHGTPSAEAEKCGPCQRTGSPCIRHPRHKKCALCFRRHDVCEMWDDSIENIKRRRAHTRTYKRDTKVVMNDGRRS
jgi:hypothetical protein